MPFSGRLKQLQDKKYIKTQVELAKFLGFSTSVVSSWLRGEKLPSMDTALIISKKLGCTATWLLTGGHDDFDGTYIDLPKSEDYLEPNQATLDYMEEQAAFALDDEGIPLGKPDRYLDLIGLTASQCQLLRKLAGEFKSGNNAVLEELKRDLAVIAERKFGSHNG